jgi:hypothetical protein
MVTSMISSPIPTAPGLPLVGNALAYRRNRLALWMQVRETCGDIGLVRLGSRSLLLVSSPELIHERLKSDLNGERIIGTSAERKSR